MPKRSVYIVLCLLLFSAITSSAQATEQSGFVKTADGVLVVWNEPGNCYTLEIKGKTIKPVQDHALWFTVDGKFFQIVTASKSEFLKDPNEKSLDDKAILSSHQVWESDYIAETLNSKLKVGSELIKLSNGTTAMKWSFDMPHVADKQTAIRQLYLSVVKGDRVLALNTVVEANDDETTLQKLLIDTMTTLKPSDKPLSLEKASEQILKNK